MGIGKGPGTGRGITGFYRENRERIRLPVAAASQVDAVSPEPGDSLDGRQFRRDTSYADCSGD
jgi:hypothetical protein